MRLARQPKRFFGSAVILILLLISNTSCSNDRNPIRRTLDRRDNWSWSKPLQKLLKTSEQQKKSRFANYGIFIDRKWSQGEAEDFRAALETGLVDGKSGRYSFASTYPFEEPPKLDMVFAKLDTSIVAGIKNLRIVKDILLSETLEGGDTAYFEESKPPTDWSQTSQSTQEVRMLNQAPMQAESDAAPDPKSSQGKGITIFMVDTGAYSTDERVIDWIWPGEQPHEKFFRGTPSNPELAFHGSTVLDFLQDPRGGAGLSKVVVVRPPPNRGMETLLDTINQIGLYVKTNGLQGVTAINWSYGWTAYARNAIAWVDPILERYAWLTRGYGSHSIIAAGNNVQFPFKFKGFPEFYYQDLPVITVGNVLDDGKTMATSQAPNLVTTNAMGSWVETPDGRFVTGTSFSTPQITARIAEWLSPGSPWREHIQGVFAQKRKSLGLRNSEYGEWDGWAQTVEWLVRMKSHPRTQIDPDNYAPIFWSGYDSRYPDSILYDFYPGDLSSRDADSWGHLQSPLSRIKEVEAADISKRRAASAAASAKIDGDATRNQTGRNSNTDVLAAKGRITAGNADDQISDGRDPIKEIVSTENSAAAEVGNKVGSGKNDLGPPKNVIVDTHGSPRRPPRSLSRILRGKTPI